MPSYIIAAEADDGFVTAGGLWEETNIQVPDGNYFGLRFTGLPFRSVARGAGQLHNATTILATTSLSLVQNFGGGGGGTLRIEIVPEANPAVFGPDGTATRNPGTLNEALVTTYTVAPSLPIPTTHTIGLDPGPIGAFQRRDGFQGVVAFSILWTATSSGQTIFFNDFVIVPRPTFTTTEGPVFTGLEGPWQAQGRADYCPKCAQPSTRDTWVMDGYTKSMVCSRCWDPADDSGKFKPSREQPPIGEG